MTLVRSIYNLFLLAIAHRLLSKLVDKILSAIMGTTMSDAESVGYGTPSLLGVPLSVQKKIYTYAVVTNDIIDLTKKSFQKHNALLNTCKTARQVATPIFFSRNSFIITNIRSEGANFVKHADSHLTKLLIDFSPPPKLRKKYPRHKDPKSRDAMAVYEELKDLPAAFASYLLMWDVSVDAIEVVPAEVEDGKPSTHQIIVDVLNTTFKAALKIQSQPVNQAAMRFMKQQVEKVAIKDSEVTGRDPKVALRDKDYARKAAASIIGDKVDGVGGMGAGEAAGDGSQDAGDKENKKGGGDATEGTKKRDKKKKPKKKSGSGQGEEEVHDIHFLEMGNVAHIWSTPRRR